MALLNPSAVKKTTYNTKSGGQAVTLTPEQQKKIAGSSIGGALGVATTPPATPPATPPVDRTGGTMNTKGASTGTQQPVKRDSAGNAILGTVGGKNILGGGTVGTTNIDRTAGIAGNPMSQFSPYFTPEYTINRRNEIFKETERARQSQIDAINTKYRSQVETEQQAGAEDLARQRSMNLRSGLGGSDFGAANKAEVRNRTNSNVAAIQANQDIAVGNVISEIEQLANQRFQLEQNALQQGFSNAMQSEQFAMQKEAQAAERQEKLRKQTLESVANIAQMNPNISMAQLAQMDPALYESVQYITGMSDFEVDAYMNAKNGVTTESLWKGSKLVQLRKDAQGNVLSTQTYASEDLGIPPGFDPYFITDERSGMTYFYNKEDPELDENGVPKLKPMGKFGLSVFEQKALSQSGNTAEKLRQTAVIESGGKKLLIDEQTGEVIREFGEGEAATVEEFQQESKAEYINTIDSLKTHPGKTGVVGPNPLARMRPIAGPSGQTSDFVAGVEQLQSSLSLDQLIKAKERGATFGALSDQEMKILSAAGSKLGTWAVKDEAGNVKYYKASEKAFNSELDKISNYAKLDYVLKGGDPAKVNVQVFEDGSYWTQDSSGNLTKIR